MKTDPAHYQKKRRLNHKMMLMLTYLNSQRRIKKQLNCNLQTVVLKLIYLDKKAVFAHDQAFINQHYDAKIIQLLHVKVNLKTG